MTGAWRVPGGCERAGEAGGKGGGSLDIGEIHGRGAGFGGFDMAQAKHGGGQHGSDAHG